MFIGYAFIDVVQMIAVIGEIPTSERVREFRRVSLPHGNLAISELLLDPDYPLTLTIARMAHQVGLWLKEKIGRFFYHTLMFEKSYVLKAALPLNGEGQACTAKWKHR